MATPPEVYGGSDPFVFVCYAHVDQELVYPELARLSEAGFNIWYDDGIVPGSEWTAAIAGAIERCSAFLYFVSPRSVESEHCRREITFALEESRPMLAVHLEETQVPAALRLSLSHRQALMKYRDPRYESRVIDALTAALAGEDTETGREITIGEAVLGVDERVLRIGERSVQLDPKDVSVLLHLVESSPHVVPTELLLSRSWPGTVVGDNALQQVIGRLRKAFSDNARNPRVIETIPRRGYRLMVGNVAAASGSELNPSVRNESQIARWVWSGLALAGLVAVAVLTGGLFEGKTDGGDDPRRIVLLPFEDLNPRDDFDLADDISTSVRNHLARLDGVEMIAGRSAEIAGASDADIPEIADRLGVSFVITGSVNRRGDQIRVSVQLLEGGTGVVIDTAEVRREVDTTSDYFDLYDEIAGRVSGSFPFEFASATTVEVRHQPPVEAYEKVSRAWTGPERTSIKIRLLDEAIAIDPEYARAYAVRSMYKALQAENRRVRPLDGFRSAREDAERALQIDSTEPLALAMRASMYDRLDLDFPKALAGYREALAHGAMPNEMGWYQDTLTNAGLYEIGLANTTSSELLNPLDAHSMVFSARFLWRLGREQEAIQKMEEALKLENSAQMVVGNAFDFFYHQVGDIERANRLISEIQGSDVSLRRARSMISLAEGNPNPLRDWLQERERTSGYIDPLRVGNGYYELGDYEKHIEWWRRRIEDRANVGWIMDILRRFPDYWPNLEGWAGDDKARTTLLEAHKALIAEVTKNMRVPRDWTPN